MEFVGTRACFNCGMMSGHFSGKSDWAMSCAHTQRRALFSQTLMSECWKREDVLHLTLPLESDSAAKMFCRTKFFSGSGISAACECGTQRLRIYDEIYYFQHLNGE